METGERINGRYKIIRSIGSGGMAKVYLARDLILERDVAVKLMAYNFHNDENSIRRFKREALATTELVHPNIVNIYDVGENEKSLYCNGVCRRNGSETIYSRLSSNPIQKIN